MPGPGLIRDYLAELSADLPGRIVEELADGLDETYRCYLGRGLADDAAAQATVAEFGEPRVIVAAFTKTSPGRRAARRLLVAGPGVGACWAVVLITARAWQWPVSVLFRAVFGIMLITVIGLLTAAALGRRYRLVCRAAAAGCAGTAILDVAMISTVVAIAATPAWPLAVAIGLSAVRCSFAIRNVHHALTG